MNEPKPKYLYKFCSAERAIQVIRDRYLYLCPPVDLNDMHEGTIQYLLRYSEAAAFALMSRRVEVQCGYNKTEAAEVIKDCIKNDEIDEYFFWFAERLKSINLQMRQHSGITCFTERLNDQRMWGHTRQLKPLSS